MSTGTSAPVVHREHEYDSRGFDLLWRMQRDHFWYRGRHRFLLAAMKKQLARTMPRGPALSGIDLGGGCGGWVRYLCDRFPGAFSELTLADSSPRALELAAEVLPADVAREQVDLLALPWRDRWDVAFLLDVLEHIPQDEDALREIGRSLKPGGLLFVTTPALNCFWSWNDDAAQHQRRYSRADFAHLAESAGLQLVDARYFMFLLSPLQWAARRKRPPLDRMSRDEINRLIARTHRVPTWPVNELCAAIFAAEAPLGLNFRFPWGTSILGVFQKERAS